MQVTAYCEYCGKEFEVPKHAPNQKTCSRRCGAFNRPNKSYKSLRGKKNTFVTPKDETRAGWVD
jgi:hypothetical protein